MKKILYIHHGQGLGGAPLSLLYLIEGLNKKLYKPVVLFLKDSEVIDLYKSKDIEVYGPLNMEDFSHTKIWWYKWYHPHHLLKAIWHTIKTALFVGPYWLQKINPDIVHLNTSSLIVWGRAAYKFNIPVVWHVREPLASGYLGIRRKIVQKCVEWYSTMILPICKNDAKPWEHLEKTRVTYNAVNSKMFDPDKVKPLDIRGDILFLGGLSKEKGTHIIFTVMKELIKIRPDAKLLVAGYFDKSLKSSNELGYYLPTERYKRKLLKLLDDIKDNVICLGPIQNVPSAMLATKMVVFPATVGHFARPIIEAGFMKKPVVASNLAPLDELVRDGETGYLVDVNDISAWVKCIDKLIDDNLLNQRMGYAGIYRGKQYFDIKSQIAGVRKVYKSLI